MSQLNKTLTYGTTGGLLGLGHARDTLKGVAKNATAREQLSIMKNKAISAGKHFLASAPSKTASFIKKSADHQ